ncbi:MAG TPA: TolC family protein [Steroidobacteraceae bacterium]|jgi:multidrug efflux system outer membrane protein|nr:TolC family protein [Steroidobacteraceae bacterium]
MKQSYGSVNREGGAGKQGRSARAARGLALLALSAALAACAVGPTYRAPPAPVVAPRNLGAAFAPAAPSAEWWRQFGDAVLADLESHALAQNLDLELAVARVRAARAAFAQARFDYAPHVTLDGSYERSKEQQPGFTSDRVDVDATSIGFDASWEVDLFGHVRHEAAAARAELGAQQANLADARVIVAAEVARNYFELRGTQRRIAVAHDNIKNQEEALRLTRVRFEAGKVTELDTDSAEARLKATEASLPLLESDAKQRAYRLAVLLGMEPGSLDDRLTGVPVSVMTAPLPIGDVSTLLRTRPDVRAAERELAAATERVGVATADLFPRVTFTGFVGFLSGDTSQIGKAASRAWLMTPAVSWPALDLGSVHARLRAARAESDGALAVYRKAALAALEDFEDSCAGYAAEQTRLGSVIEQAEASRRAERLAEIQYREGSTNFLVLLDAQRTLLEAEDALAQAETAANTGAVAVYKALGGAEERADRRLVSSSGASSASGIR